MAKVGLGPSARSGWPWQRWLLLLIVLLAAAVRCLTLSFQSLWLDELSTVLESGQSWRALLLALVNPRHGYPLYLLGMRLWTALFGAGEVALRWPSALAGVCTVPLLYWIGRRLYGRAVGLLAATLLAVSPLAAWYSQEARAYAIVVLLATAASLCLWEATERQERRWWWAGGLLMVGAFFVHRLVAVLALVGQLAYLLYVARQGRVWRERRALLVGVLAGILLITMAGLWFVIGASRQFEDRGLLTSVESTFSQFSLRIPPWFPELGQGPDRRPWLLPFVLAALAGVAALVEGVRSHGLQRRRAVFLATFFFIPPGAFFLFYLVARLGQLLHLNVQPFFYDRYLLGALPGYLLLLAVGIAALWRWAGRLNRKGRTLPALFLGLLSLGTLLVPMEVSWRQLRDWTLSRLPSKEQFREATRALQEQLHPGELVIIYPNYLGQDINYYRSHWPRVPLDLHMLPDLETAGYNFRDFEEDMRDMSYGRRRAWLLIAPAHAKVQYPDNWYWATDWFSLETTFLRCGEQHFNGLDLYCVAFNMDKGEEFPTPQVPLQADFGGQIRLFGADLQPFFPDLQPGDSLPLDLYEQGLRDNPPDLEVVVRLVGPDGKVWSEAARQPFGGTDPRVVTSRWLKTDQFLDSHELLLPKLPPGRYTVQVGYRPVSDPAAPLLLPDGSAWAVISTVNVVQGSGR